MSEEVKEDDDMGFWQTSDKVTRSTILAVTSLCKNSDCRLSAREQGTTLMAISDWYDKEGWLHTKNDNHRYTRVCCCTCWTEWDVHQSGDRITKMVKIIPKTPEPKNLWRDDFNELD